MKRHGSDSACSLLIGQHITLLFFLIIILHGQISNAVTETPTTRCDHSYNYTEGSTFESNLKRVFDSLVEGANKTGFNNSVYGQSPDRIYGLLQCREDMTVDQCNTCSQFAMTSIQQQCGNAGGGSAWPFQCFLRYENYSFFGILDTDLGSNFGEGFGGDTGVIIPTDFQAAAENLLKNLSGEAAPKPKRSALGTAVDSLSQTIYGLVQCTRDLSTGVCTTCLSYSIDKMFTTYPGHAGIQYWSQSCILRYEIYPFFNSTTLPPETPPKQVTPSSNSRPMKSSNKTPVVLGVVGGFVLLLMICLFAIRRRLKYAIFPPEGHDEVEEETLVHHDPQVFTLERLLVATKNFHDDNKLGEGGFGSVYKGTTPDGKLIAVKKLSLKSVQGKKEFMNEVKLVAKIQHRNLVNLLGCCAEGSERLLVYEYLSNKSLDKILFDPNKSKQLDWPKRYNIIMGVARGLLYLHQDSQLRIIHRDIKASNVLLDEKLNPKIADFGLAKLFPDDESHINTRVAGTYGYMPPEYAMQGQLSVKTDVYSFGVLLLELISGRKNTDYSLPPEMQILLGWAWRCHEGGNIVQMIDPAIIKTCDEQELLRCIHVGLLCTQADSSLRPPMSTVILMLSTDSVTGFMDPTRPAFVTSQFSENIKSGLPHSASATASSSSSPGPPSNATVSMSDMVPR